MIHAIRFISTRSSVVFDGLNPNDQSEVALVITVDTQSRYREVRFVVPKGKLLSGHDHIVFERYMLARINNLLVTFGGTRLCIYYDLSDDVIGDAIKKAIARYDVDRGDNYRGGLGCIMNYISRMNVLLGLPKFSVTYQDISTYLGPPAERKEFKLYDPNDADEDVKILYQAASTLEDKVFCGLDVGGNAIKAAVVYDGKKLVEKTYSWFPTFLKTADELIDPIILLIRFMRVVTELLKSRPISEIVNLKAMLVSTADYSDILAFTEELESGMDKDAGLFDGVVIGFPDIVIDDRVAGGESYKQRGIRMNPDVEYEREFEKQRDIYLLAEKYIKKDGLVKVVNDGNVSSLVFAVEQVFAESNIIDRNGMLVHTIGTEMGTGLITRGGTIQWIPLEGYNYMIDMGSDDYQCYDADDVRSVNNFSSKASGTVQKYVSQMGMFRIALRKIQEQNPEIYDALIADGYLNYDEKADKLLIETNPSDMRSPLTRKLIGLLKKGNQALIDTFEEIGQCLGIVTSETSIYLRELSTTKLISGGDCDGAHLL